MVERLENVTENNAIGINAVRNLAIRNYNPNTPVEDYESLSGNNAVYSCDAACKNCHCAAF